MSTSIVRVLVSCALALASLAAAAEPDPPARVGRASLVEGDVAYLREGEWIPLPVNWPITTGTRLSAAPGARAEVRAGSTAIRLAGATEVEVTQLDDDAIALRLLNGTIDARVRDGEVARAFSVATPEARATLLEPGRYRFDAGVVPETTAVSADIGAARVEAGGNSFVVRPGKRAEVWRNGDVLLAEARPDAFDEWALARDRRDEASRSARYVSPEMTGYESLDEHGDWREVPQYGPVWVPRTVPVGWAPYRAGRWAWVEPWGWTWIDEAPWGFAPFHYGRWAFVGGVWAWAPGRVIARPVYAPALVGWVGRPGWSVSVSIGTVPAVGWFPLAPREVFVPAYRHSPAYVRNVNVAHVTNVTHITNVTHVNYVNRRIDRAVTVVPAAAVTSGQPIARSHVQVRRAELDRHAPASPTPPVAAIAPPRPIAPHAARDDRGPQRQFDPGPRSPEAPRAERRDERRHDVRTQPSPNIAATPSAPPVTRPAPATPTRASDPPRPAVADRPQARGNERGPDAPPRVVETRPAPRSEPERAGQRVEPLRAIAPVAPMPSPVQAQPRTEPRMADTRPEPRRDVQRVEPARAVAPTPQAPQPQVRNEPRAPDTRPEPRQEARRVEPPRAIAPAAPTPQPSQPQVRNEPRPEIRRVEPPRAIAPAAQTLPQPQTRHEPRAAPPTPVVRAAPPAPPAAVPAPQPQPQPQQSAPRGDRERGQAREQRRGEGRGAG